MNDKGSVAAIHDANCSYAGFGHWHVWCCCGWPTTTELYDLRREHRLLTKTDAELAVYAHLLEFEPDRARRYASEKGITV